MSICITCMVHVHVLEQKKRNNIHVYIQCTRQLQALFIYEQSGSPRHVYIHVRAHAYIRNWKCITSNQQQNNIHVQYVSL